MKVEDLEKALKDAILHHLKDDVLVSYRDQKLDAISRTQAEAHLNRCLICESRLSLLQGELAAIDLYQPGPDDRARARRVLHLVSSEQPVGSEPVRTAILERLKDYLRQSAASWQAFGMQFRPVRGSTRGGSTRSGKEIWRWMSEDGRFVVYAVTEPTHDLTLHFSTSDSALEGERLEINVGSLRREATLRRVSESESHAEVVIKRHQRPKHLTDISIELG